ncbi:hypothetical protein [Dehalobacter restrictus]|uniref:Uncharacterized protein n=1 Tax=Dehalobacter restrictus TaxID=55583 RepID=A0A857DKV9_9FIRM|nr:hypothetical protein [Dehalobacter restrictus]QHA01443.1 hypothetical protein GQ588_12735 [Dehalobacter restrictus]
MKNEDQIILYTTDNGKVTVSVHFEDRNFGDTKSYGSFISYPLQQHKIPQSLEIAIESIEIHTIDTLV